MDYWQNFELSTKTLQPFIENLDLLEKFLTNPEKCGLFFKRFPFEQLFNFSLLDGSNVMMCIVILELFTNYDEFYTHIERFNYILEFVLINLSHVTRDCREILLLLKLLSKILSRFSNAINYSFKNVFDRERIVEILLKMCKFKSVRISNFSYYTSILKSVIDSNCSDTVCSLLSKLFNEFGILNASMEQISICKLIINSESTFFRNCFANVWEWLANKCPTLLEKTTDVNMLESIVYCLIAFSAYWAHLHVANETRDLPLWQKIENMHYNLTKQTSNICLLASKNQLRSNCFKLLKIILLKFVDASSLSSDIYDEIITSFEKLPEDVESWAISDNDIFLCICHICVLNKSMIWKEKDVLRAMMGCFYNRKHIIKIYILKSIYYLYPVLINNVDVDISIAILGDDLLNYFSKICSVSYLYSYNRDQLKWILERASKSVKVTVLTHWITFTENNEKLEEVLISVLQSCKSEIMLLHLMINNYDKPIGLRSAMLLQKVQNEKVSTLISFILPFSIEKPVIFQSLLLAKPGVIADTHYSLQICSLMGAVIPSLSDSVVLRGACIFSGKLIASNKTDSRFISNFCRNGTNIKYLIDITEEVDDETGVAVIRLLKVIIAVQRQNKLNLGYTIENSFRGFINGSPEKIEKSLQLFYYANMFRYSLIVLDSKYVLDVYHILLDYSLECKFQADAWRCIITLVKKMPWLALTMSSSIHIERACQFFSNMEIEANVFKMLTVWLDIIRREPFNGFVILPESTIKSFILRSNLPEYRMKTYLTELDHLIKRGKTQGEELNPTEQFTF